MFQYGIVYFVLGILIFNFEFATRAKSFMLHNCDILSILRFRMIEDVLLYKLKL